MGKALPMISRSELPYRTDEGVTAIACAHIFRYGICILVIDWLVLVPIAIA